MNKLIRIFTALLGLWIFSCSPDEADLGNVDVSSNELVEGIAFKIEHDATNPNIVYLTSLMDSRYTPQWDHPQGRSQKQTVRLEIPFAGTYTVKFGVQTRGGIVYGEPVTFTVDEMYAGFISDPIWTMIAGGADEEKIWYLDLDAEGVSRKFAGPMYFFSNWYTWDGLHTPAGDNYIDAQTWDWKKAITPTVKRVGDAATGAEVPGEVAWYWQADWKGNQWMCDKADFGTMKFDLKGGANVEVDQEDYGLGLATGSYLIDVENKMIKFTDVRPLHDSNRDGDAVDWSNVRILYLTEDAMQLGVVPNSPGAAMVVYNYISKEYRDNWVPVDQPEPEPPYEGDANEDLTTSVSTKKKWGLSLNTPYNWTGLGGNFLNGWSTPADYTATGWAPYDASLISNVSLTFNRETETTGAYEFTDGAGALIDGTYTVDAENNIVFDEAISFSISGWVSLATSAKPGHEKKLRIITAERDAFGNISKLWLGQRSADKDEYMVYAFEPQAVGGTDPTTAMKALLSAKTWKLDTERTYDVATSWGAEQGPMIFSDFATWSWNPLPGEHYASGEDNIDYGSLKFNTNGTVTVQQRKRIYTYNAGADTRNGMPQGGDVLASDEVVTLNGTYSVDLDDNTIDMSVGLLHPWTCDYTVADWGDVKIYKATSDVILLQVTRSAALSGEGEIQMTYVYVPAP
ncbi:MAG TPA: hypothetical protein VGK59_00960 [Ohtaekwangia sp.]